MKYLDIGVGDGSFTKEVANIVKAQEVYGVDISERAVSLAQLKGIRAVKVDLNEEQLPYPEESFELVTAIEIVEHLVNTDNLISEVYRVLKPGGYFLVTSPNLASWLCILSLILGYQPYDVSFRFRIGKPLGKKIRIPLAEKPIGHIKLYVPRALKEHVEVYGFKVLLVTGVRLIEGTGILNVIEFLDSLFSKAKRYASGTVLLAVRTD